MYYLLPTLTCCLLNTFFCRFHYDLSGGSSVPPWQRTWVPMCVFLFAIGTCVRVSCIASTRRQHLFVPAIDAPTTRVQWTLPTSSTAHFSLPLSFDGVAIQSLPVLAATSLATPNWVSKTGLLLSIIHAFNFCSMPYPGVSGETEGAKCAHGHNRHVVRVPVVYMIDQNRPSFCK